MSSFADAIIELPRPDNVEAAKRGREKWDALAGAGRGGCDATALTAVGADERLAPLLEGVFGSSPYLTNLALREPDVVTALLSDNADVVFERIVAEIDASWREAPSKRVFGERLRQAKRRAALLVALADVGGVWPLERTTAALSQFADRSVEAALAFLLTELAGKGVLELADPVAPTVGCGLFALGMGKLGARELNYSSDIDLIVLFDADQVSQNGGRGLSDEFSRLTRSLVQLMQERTAGGYVLRTDLRLRPDPSSSPLALSVEAALTYYETMAQNWERAAMIKARPSAGDLAAGGDFLAEISPFIWRKSLDFAAIQDIQSIKRQIHSHKGHGRLAILGHDIKVGRGGIREIEFFAQTQQLIAGGRDPRLRVPTTVGALAALVETGRLSPEVADDLSAAYRFLRRLEHRLQMLDDAQTQRLPDTEDGFRRLALFSGYDDADALKADVRRHMTAVQDHYADLFAEAPSLAAERGNLVFTGTDNDPDTVESLRAMGYASPESAIGRVRAWHAGRYRATRTTRARQLLNDLVPPLLKAVGATSNPDAALSRFDQFLGRLPSGIQFMSLLHANPGLLRLLARIMGTAPGLAEALSRNAGLLDCLLEPADDDANERAALEEVAALELSKALDFEGALDAMRRFANDQRFRIGVDLLEGRIDINAAGLILSTVAEIALAALLPRVAREVERRHGRVGDAGMAVIAMGKLGGQEMTFGSDLDLVFVYDDRGEVRESDGKATLSIGPYFTRLSQRYISAITTLTSEGQLYEVDMRLRPSGNSGAVAVPLSAYAAYMRDDAWTWEVMAATRARTIAGPAGLCAAVDEALVAAITRPHDPADLRTRVSEMRQRIDKTHGTRDIWSVKHVQGGLVDLEFTIQYLVLAKGGRHPELINGNVALAIRRLREAGVLDAADAATLADAQAVLQTVQSLIRLCFGRRFDESAASPDFRELAARLLDCRDFDAVRARLEKAEAGVAGVYDRIVGRDTAAAEASD